MSHAAAADPTLVFAFVAGLASFLSPCVLPVIPAFLAHLAGTTLEAERVDRRAMFRGAFLFVLGFSLVFGILGVLLNAVLQDVANTVLLWLSRIAGVFIILFGLHLTGLIRVSLLDQQHELPLPDAWADAGTPLVSFLFGAAFAVGWTPCVGPILGSIFALAAAQPASAFTLLTVYSIGLGVPFLAVGAFPTRVTEFLRSHRELFHQLQTVFGAVLIVLGVLVFTMQLDLVANVPFLTEVVL